MVELLTRTTETQRDAGGSVISAMQAHMLKQISTVLCCSTTGSHFRGSHSKPASQRGAGPNTTHLFWEQHRSAPSCCPLSLSACLSLPCWPAAILWHPLLPDQGLSTSRWATAALVGTDLDHKKGFKEEIPKASRLSFKSLDLLQDSNCAPPDAEKDSHVYHSEPHTEIKTWRSFTWNTLPSYSLNLCSTTHLQEIPSLYQRIRLFMKCSVASLHPTLSKSYKSDNCTESLHF